MRTAAATLTSAKSHVFRSATFSKWKSAPAQRPGIRIAVRRSPGSSTVMRVMSTPGDMKNFAAGTTRSRRALRTTIPASSATRAGATSDGVTATQRSAPKMACSRFMAPGAPA